MKQPNPQKNYVCITGASSGIGLACAREYAKLGYSLILIARRHQRLNKLRKELLNLSRAQTSATKPLIDIQIFSVDISQPRQITQLFSRHKKLFSHVSILINNAGLALGIEPFQESKLSDQETMFKPNVLGSIHFSRQILPQMIARQSGHLVFLGSVAGHFAYRGGHGYCATKAAIASLVQSLRIDLLGTGVRVTEIAPGMVETEFSVVRLKSRSKARKVYEHMTPLTAQDIARNVLWCTLQPERVNIQSLIIYPTDQAAPGQVYRKISK